MMRRLREIGCSISIKISFRLVCSVIMYRRGRIGIFVDLEWRLMSYEEYKG